MSDRNRDEDKTETFDDDHPSPPITRKPRYPYTAGLVILLLLVYLVTSFPDFRFPQPWALEWGVFYPQAVQNGEIWRMMTANFLHANWNHLLGNCFAIFIFGRLLEPILRQRGPGIMYSMGVLILFSTLMTTTFSYFFLHAPTLGASGIVFGLIGAYMTLVLLFRRKQDRAVFRQELRGALGYLLLIGIWNVMDSQTVNFWGHAGGLCAGILFAFHWFSGISQKAA